LDAAWVLRRFGENVRGRRQELGWSQQRLADAAGLDRTYVSGVERGVRNPTVTTVHTLALALGVELRDLLSLPPEPTSTLNERLKSRSDPPVSVAGDDPAVRGRQVADPSLRLPLLEDAVPRQLSEGNRPFPARQRREKEVRSPAALQAGRGAAAGNQG